MVQSLQQHYVLPFYMGWNYTLAKSAGSISSMTSPEYFQIPEYNDDGCKNSIERVTTLIQALLVIAAKNNNKNEKEEEAEEEEGHIVIPEGFGTLSFARVPNFQLLLHNFTSISATCIMYKILTPNSSPSPPTINADTSTVATNASTFAVSTQNALLSLSSIEEKHQEDDIYSIQNVNTTEKDPITTTTTTTTTAAVTVAAVAVAPPCPIRHKTTCIVFGSHVFVYRRQLVTPSFMCEYRPTIFLDVVDSRFGIEAVSESKHLLVKYDDQLLEWPYYIYTDGRDIGKNRLVSYENTDGYETCIIYNQKGQIIRAWRRLVAPLSPLPVKSGSDSL
jgi:hypothetical protein